MAYHRKSPIETAQRARDGVAEWFTPRHVHKQDYEIQPRTGESVTIHLPNDWSEDLEYGKWERVDYILRLMDFINTLGISTFPDKWITRLYE